MVLGNMNRKLGRPGRTTAPAVRPHRRYDRTGGTTAASHGRPCEVITFILIATAVSKLEQSEFQGPTR